MQQLTSRLINMNELHFGNSMSHQLLLNEDDHLEDSQTVLPTQDEIVSEDVNVELSKNSEIMYLNMIIKEKTKLSEELYDKIKILNKYIVLLEKKEKKHKTEEPSRGVPQMDCFSDLELQISEKENHETTDADKQVMRKQTDDASDRQCNVANISQNSSTQGNKKRKTNKDSKTERYGASHVRKPAVEKTIIEGTMSAASFQGRERKAWIWVGRVSVGTEEVRVLEHLQERFPGRAFSVEKLPFRDGAYSCAFKVGADLSLMDELYKAENWPRGVSVRKFRIPFRRQHYPSGNFQK